VPEENEHLVLTSRRGLKSVQSVRNRCCGTSRDDNACSVVSMSDDMRLSIFVFLSFSDQYGVFLRWYSSMSLRCSAGSTILFS